MTFLLKTKTLLPLAALALLPFSAAFADETAVATPAAETDAVADNNEKIREMLFNREIKTEEDFANALKQAKALGASEQLMLEAEIFRVVVLGGTADALSLAKRLEAAAPTWDLENAVGIRDKKIIEVFAHLLRAKHALTAGDEKTFQAEAAEAAWGEPQIVGFINRMKSEGESTSLEKLPEFVALDKAVAAGEETGIRKAFVEAFSCKPPASQELAIQKVQSWREAKEAAEKAAKAANLRLPLDFKFEQAVGEPVTLADLLKDKKAILLDFHASWCGPCMQVMPMLPKEAEKLVPQGVAVAAINTQSLEDAKKVQKRFNLEVPVLAEKGSQYSKLLDVDSIPRYVIVSAEGKVLFNGHPADHGAMAKALEKIGVKIEVPAASSEEAEEGDDE